MDALIPILIILFIILTVVTVLGHAIWLLCEAAIRALRGSKPAQTNANIVTWICEACGSEVRATWSFCGRCGSANPFVTRIPSVTNLHVTEKVTEWLYTEGKLDHCTLELVKDVLHAERNPSRHSKPAQEPPQKQITDEPSVKVKPETPTLPTPVVIEKQPVVFQPAQVFRSNNFAKRVVERPLPAPRPPRRSFSEMLNSFMEESNIRWGEIIGGLLIIGCSTALVVSLWSQISQIPVLKFLIFTTVTAVLFGVGIYTDHRWKLPTTSRAILTIATLLVPLNFLAIAAVSASETSGPLVLASEFLAPAIFLCLVFFGGRIITPGCAHLLAAGVLGSSVGQLLVRHFASVDASPWMLIALGGFPVVFYVLTLGFALRRVHADKKIDEHEITTVFTVLGTMAFAALLPFGLLLYRSGPLWLSMMYLAPLVTLWGVPLLATGTVLWRRIENKSFVASRTTATALGILGLMIALAGILLAWPNPASIVPAALLNFAILTTLAFILEVPFAHFIASICFGLAYLVVFHVAAGNVEWQNLRVSSLLHSCLQISTGQSLIGAFAMFLIAHEWLKQLGRKNASQVYLISSCLVGVISLFAITAFGPLGGNELQFVWVAYLIYSLAAFWLAWREEFPAFTWAGSALLLFALASQFAWGAEISFPWQTAFLVHASLSTVLAILTSRRERLNSISRVLNHAAQTSLVLAVISFFQANPWQVTWMQTERIFWIAGILLLSLWLNRRQLLFIALQISLTAGVILSVKATLQEYEWYTYTPHAFLHPAALQIQGTMLALLCLVFIAARFLLKKVVSNDDHALAGLWKLLDTKQSVDRLIPWVLLVGFMLLSVYCAASGVMLEFATRGSNVHAWNVAGFPHQEAYGLGSWIVLGLLMLIMVANAWERRQRFYLSGALAVITAAIPLLAGRFESELATATAWRFLAARFLVLGSILIWARARVITVVKSFGWPELIASGGDYWRRARVLLFAFTVAPLVLLTFYPGVRAITYSPVSSPLEGIFSLLSTELSYAIPLIIVAAVFTGYSVFERLPFFNFYSCLTVSSIVTLIYLFSATAVGVAIDSSVLVKTIQLNAIAFAVHTLVWLSLRDRWLRRLEHRATQVNSLLTVEMWLAVGLNLVLWAPLAGLLILENEPGTSTLIAGSSLGWFAFAVTSVALVALRRSRNKAISVEIFASILLCLACLLSFGFADWENSIALCTLTGGVTVVACLVFLCSFLPKLFAFLKFDDDWSTTSIHLSAVIAGIATILCLRLLPVIGPTRAWWSITPLLALTVLAASLQFQTVRRRYLYAAGTLFNIAISLWWLESFDSPGTALIEVNIIAASLAGVIWLCLELRARKLRDVGHAVFSYHNLVAVLSLLFLILATWVRFALHDSDIQLLWLAFATALVLMFATLWDSRAKYTTVCLYVLGLVAAAIVLLQQNLQYDDQAWSVMMFLAFYALATSLLWHQRAMILAFAKRIGIAPRIASEASGLTWLSVVTMMSTLTIGSIAYWTDLRFMSSTMRISAALAVIAQSITFGLLAEGVWAERWRRASIAMFLIGSGLLGWSFLTPGLEATWFNRSVILMVETLSLTALFGLVSRRVQSAHELWTNSFRTSLPAILGVGIVALVFCLTAEVYSYFRFGAVSIQAAALLAIALTLAATSVLLVLFALFPEHDPLSLKESGRMKYVWFAEVVLALLFLHTRLTMPWLFTGFFEDYWPFVVMAIAYLGVIASESLRKRKLIVLAHPIERTGVFLPLLPVVGFWVVTSQVDYSSLLFVVGGLY
jgi:hypothetical protein